MFGQGHPLKPLAYAIDNVHERSEHGKNCVEFDCWVQQLLQQNNANAKRAIGSIIESITTWLPQEPTLLSYRGDALHAIETCDVRSPQEMVRALKSGTTHVCGYFTHQWAKEAKPTEDYTASAEILHRIDTDMEPEDDIAVGFHTPAKFIGNSFLLAMQVLRQERNASAVNHTRVQMIGDNTARNLGMLLASCRKDVFLSIDDAITPRKELQKMYELYDPEKFELVGAESDNTLQLSIRLDVIQDVRGAMHGLTRQKCPALGKPMMDLCTWQSQVYKRYFVRHLDQLFPKDELLDKERPRIVRIR